MRPWSANDGVLHGRRGLIVINVVAADIDIISACDPHPGAIGAALSDIVNLVSHDTDMAGIWADVDANDNLDVALVPLPDSWLPVMVMSVVLSM